MQFLRFNNQSFKNKLQSINTYAYSVMAKKYLLVSD